MSKSSNLDLNLKKTLPMAVEAALKAGKYIQSKFGKYKKIETKSDSSWVTEVDKKSEDMILKILKKSFPTHGFHGEESGLSFKKGAEKSKYRWHIDPLDGTTNFIHNFPIFCVSIGLEDVTTGQPILGVIYQPMTKNLYTGYSGGGAFLNQKKIKVAATSDFSESLLSTGFSLKKDNYFNDEMKTFSRMAYDSNSIRRTGSAAMDLIYVASGCFDGFWERGLAPWDIAAALAILKEAGGQYSQIDGSPFRLGDLSIVATNGKLHKPMIAALTGK